jgi:hypothetical protein
MRCDGGADAVASAARGQMRRRHHSRAWRRGRARPEDKTEDGANVIRADQRDERRKDERSRDSAERKDLSHTVEPKPARGQTTNRPSRVTGYRQTLSQLPRHSDPSCPTPKHRATKSDLMSSTITSTMK